MLGTILIPVLNEEATAPPATKTPRVHTFMFSVPEQGMEPWRSKVVVDSAAATALASAMSRTLLDSLTVDDNQGQKDTTPKPLGGGSRHSLNSL